MRDISYAIWLYYNFNLSYRDVETILYQRGVIASYEAIRCWCLKFGHEYARRIRRQRPPTGDKCHIDEVFIKINGKTQYLYRAIDPYGQVLQIMVHPRRNQQAAIRFFRKHLVGCQHVPQVLITDKLRSYPVAQRKILSSVERRQHTRLNNVIENPHRRLRKRERIVQRYQAKRISSALLVGIRDHLRAFSHQTTSHEGFNISSETKLSLCYLATNYRPRIVE